MEEGQSLQCEFFPVFVRSAAAVEPCEGLFDDPAFGQGDEAFRGIGSFDDFGFEMRQDFGQGVVKNRSRIGAIGEEFFSGTETP